LKCTLKARTDHLGAPPVRRGIDHDDPEVSPLATFEARLQRAVAINVWLMRRDSERSEGSQT
jgi:hypothetical protein